MCNKDCFSCNYRDCICDDITAGEHDYIEAEDAAIKWEHMSNRQKALYKYAHSPKGRERSARYEQSDKRKQQRKAYDKSSKRKMSAQAYRDAHKEEKRAYDRRRYMLKKGIIQAENMAF